ncbi:MAG: translation initiation factor IF-3 [bacterium]
MINNNFRSKFQKTRDKDFKRINYQIRVPRIFLIDDTGKRVGEFDTPKAMEMAEEKNLDLVEVSPNANPPVCRIMDFGKYQYKKKQDQKKPKTLDTKEIRLSFKIGEHDQQIKAKRAEKFLKVGHKVKVSMMLRGRENMFVSKAIQTINKFIENLLEVGKTENTAKKQGKFIDVLIAPK